MDLKKIVAISGRSGLFEIIAQTRGGIVAQSLVDGNRVSSRITQKLSVLGDIQIYSLQGEVPLITVFEKIFKYEKGAPSRIIPKASALELEAYFFEVFDAYDESRVYVSDIKKIIQWYNILLTKNWKPNSKAASHRKEKTTSKKENQKINQTR
nr:conserved hypothetical protein [uncultured bacterium]